MIVTSIVLVAILCVGVAIPVKGLYDMAKDNKEKYVTYDLPSTYVPKSEKIFDFGLFFSKIKSIFVS
tara:strand:- start:10489 stop:10689 length:201 start_codon:yes stop_codon:yes gene_type:complete